MMRMNRNGDVHPDDCCCADCWEAATFAPDVMRQVGCELCGVTSYRQRLHLQACPKVRRLGSAGGVFIPEDPEELAVLQPAAQRKLGDVMRAAYNAGAERGLAVGVARADVKAFEPVSISWSCSNDAIADLQKAIEDAARAAEAPLQPDTITDKQAATLRRIRDVMHADRLRGACDLLTVRLNFGWWIPMGSRRIERGEQWCRACYGVAALAMACNLLMVVAWAVWGW
jgi:hypothetical protein